MADGGNQRPHETSAGLFNMWSTNVFIGRGEEAHRDGGLNQQEGAEVPGRGWEEEGEKKTLRLATKMYSIVKMSNNIMML